MAMDLGKRIYSFKKKASTLNIKKGVENVLKNFSDLIESFVNPDENLDFNERKNLEIKRFKKKILRMTSNNLVVLYEIIKSTKESLSKHDDEDSKLNLIILEEKIKEIEKLLIK